jgi:hypothetical protein
MTSIRRFAPPELLTAGAGIVLLIGMLAFPWYHDNDGAWVVVHGEVTSSSELDSNVLGGPGGYLGVAAVVLLIVLLAELIYSRLAPPRVPRLPVAWATLELSAALAVGTLLVARMLLHMGDFGWGFYPVMGAAMVLAYGAFAMGRGSSVCPANVLAGR